MLVVYQDVFWRCRCSVCMSSFGLDACVLNVLKGEGSEKHTMHDCKCGFLFSSPFVCSYQVAFSLRCTASSRSSCSIFKELISMSPAVKSKRITNDVNHLETKEACFESLCVLYFSVLLAASINCRRPHTLARARGGWTNTGAPHTSRAAAAAFLGAGRTSRGAGRNICSGGLFFVTHRCLTEVVFREGRKVGR